MAFSFSLRRWLRQMADSRRGPRQRRSASQTRPRLELLEDRLAPTVDFSISDPLPFPEGDSGSNNMLFVVTRSGDLVPAV